MLTNDFEYRWNGVTTRTVVPHLREVIPTVLWATDIDVVVQQLELPHNKVESYRHLQPLTLVLIGRPGSGKSTVAKYMSHTLRRAGFSQVSHLSDLDFLRHAFSSPVVIDSGTVSRTRDNGFFIEDRSLYEEALADVAKQVQQEIRRSDVLIIEFARNSYIDSFQMLTDRGIKTDLIVYLDVAFETAMRRNKERAQRQDGDRHYVSEKEMIETFEEDDIATFSQLYDVEVVANDLDKDLVAHQTAKGIVRLFKDAVKYDNMNFSGL